MTYYIEKEDFENADIRFEALPVDEQEDLDFKFFFEIIRNLRYDGRTFFQITPDEETVVRDIATRVGKTSFNARALLFLLYGENYSVDLPDGIGTMSFKTQENTVSSFEVSPNPTTNICLLYTSPSPRDATLSRMPSSA